MEPTAAGATFNAAAPEFARWYARLWRPLGELTVAVSRPRPGERVFDACCGSGASAVPAAHAVGPSGAVDGVDMAGALLDQGRAVASAEGLAQLTFTESDVLTWESPHSPYDLVQCAYGVFFLPDLNSGTKTLLSRLRPGGRFAVTVWGNEAMRSLLAAGMPAIASERPAARTAMSGNDPSAPLRTPAKLRAWLEQLGLERVSVTEVGFRQPLHPDDAWEFLIGAALRGYLVGLDSAAVERVRERFLANLAEQGTVTLDADSLIGLGHLGTTRPSP
ncbi:methylase [Amycolatopsis antarctica]|uniref:Methylase n=1 Tax=Amycolatopsis antarctica TaxID=1854586 RepID=A0A263D2W5_9PSEU|nr:class I SAM-dependent methyltransferase [Amycolatopsis antarctica]OZM72418.1 methylase [Amycolatopsis antarctica]